MGRADIGTAKYQSKQLKASGLQKLKYYCQICEKQCRDANGFKNHLNSPSHNKRIEDLATSKKDVVSDYSQKFQQDFLRLLRINHGTKAVNANKFYQEYILNDKNHIHMNSTRWNSLTQFIKHLGQNGFVRVDKETEDEEEFNLTIKLNDPTSKVVDSKGSNTDNAEKLKMKFITNQIKLGKQQELKQEQQLEQKQEKEVVSSKENSVHQSSEPPKPIKLSLKKNTPNKKVTKPSIFE